jgi:molybdopterin synthase catalytic subunit
MQVTVRFFAGQRDIVGAAELPCELADGATVGVLWEHLIARYPRLGGFRRRVLYAVNQEYSDIDTALHDGDEVAFIPPVSGGSDQPPAFCVTPEPLADPAALLRLVQTSADGAVVTFSGVARDNFEGRATALLEYEAFEAMATPVLAQIADEAQARFAIGRVAIHHRIGRLAVGETAVLVVVAAPHRRPAFEAALFIMDRIKEIAPIWKKEHWAAGGADWHHDE